MPFSNEIRAGASGAQSTDFYNGVTSRSLRFEKDDSSYLSFTQGTATALPLEISSVPGNKSSRHD